MRGKKMLLALIRLEGERSGFNDDWHFDSHNSRRKKCGFVRAKLKEAQRKIRNSSACRGIELVEDYI